MYDGALAVHLYDAVLVDGRTRLNWTFDTES